MIYGKLNREPYTRDSMLLTGESRRAFTIPEGRFFLMKYRCRVTLLKAMILFRQIDATLRESLLLAW